MKRNLVGSINILFCLLLKETMTQYNSPDFDEIQQFQYTYKNLPNIFHQYPNQNQYYFENKRNLRDNINYEEYNDYMEETCSCDDCDNLKPSCRNMCPNCAPSPVPFPGYVLFPYPYQYPMTSKPARSKKTTKAAVTSTAKTTNEVTTQGTTTEAEPHYEEQTVALVDKLDNSKVPDVIIEPFQVKDKSQFMVTSLRRTKPNWIPKYGILPISDQFAEKLMLQLRSMKLLHPRKDYLRDVDDIKLVH